MNNNVVPNFLIPIRSLYQSLQSLGLPSIN